VIAELVHPQHRAIFTAIYNSTWYVGSIIAAWLTYGKLFRFDFTTLVDVLGTFTIQNAWSWRIPSIVQAAPSIIQLIAIW